MKIKHQYTNPDISKLESVLSLYYSPGQFIKRNNKLMTIRKDNVTATDIYIGKQKLIISGSWPGKTQRALFYLSLFLLGIIIPAIIYFTAFYPEMKKFEKEVYSQLEKENLSD